MLGWQLMAKSKQQFINIIAMTFICILFLSGCTSDDSYRKYSSAAKEFNKIYFETVQSSDSSDPDMFLKDMQTDKNKKNIEKLEPLLKEIKQYIPKDRAPMYDNFEKRYKDLVFLQKAYENSISDDDKGRIDLFLINIGADINSWNDKSSTIQWQ